MALHNREYVRFRLGKVVDDLLDELEKDDRDLSIDTFMLVGVVNWDDGDEGEVEEPFVYSESRRSHVKLGLLRMATILLEQPMVSIDIGGDDGNG